MRTAAERLFGATAASCRRCKKIGENRRGYQSCQFETGCRFPVPPLSDCDSIALGVYASSRGCWTFTSTGLGPSIRTGLNLEAVRAVAESSGVRWSDWLIEKLNTIADVVIAYDAAEMEAAQSSKKAASRAPRRRR